MLLFLFSYKREKKMSKILTLKIDPNRKQNCASTVEIHRQMNKNSITRPVHTRGVSRMPIKFHKKVNPISSELNGRRKEMFLVEDPSFEYYSESLASGSISETSSIRKYSTPKGDKGNLQNFLSLKINFDFKIYQTHRL